jgi:geranylgeranyl diphosphate synthase, type II
MIAKIHAGNKSNSASDSRSLLPDEDVRFVEDGFRSRLSVHAGIERHLRGVVHDTLSHPGSLARAQLAFSLMRSFGFDEYMARDVGVAIEYYHTASLLFDDLPCMDNATTRRGHACPHTIHGESAAILGALSLITQGYGLLWSSLNALPCENRVAASALVNECLGLNGILNGQSYDLHFGESDRKKEDVFRIAEGKTATLIRLTLLLPAVMYGVNEVTRKTLEELAVSWGLAYQILDDFKDSLMQASETGKTTSRDEQLNHPNLPLTTGFAESLKILHQKLEQSRSAIRSMQRNLPDLTVLERLQALLESEQKKIVTRIDAAKQNNHSVMA